MDRGIPTEEVLEGMRTADPPAYYLVGTPRGRLTKLERALLPLPWQAVRAGASVKLLPQDGELYGFAESRDRVHKGSQGQGLALLGAPRMQRAMRQRQLKGLVKRLKQLQQMKFNDTRQFLLKLGEAKGRYRAAWPAECLNEPAVGLPTPIVLAGGLTPDNVTQALAVVNPYAVDVSGGVERDEGVRDEDKMRRFISGVWDVGRG